MEPGTHYLAKLELIIMFHGALRKFRSITKTSAMGVEGEGRGVRPRKPNILRTHVPSQKSAICTYLLVTFNIFKLVLTCRNILEITKKSKIQVIFFFQ